MAKCILEYNLPEDKEDLDCALNGAKYKHALWEVGQEVFRPARKHGYPNVKLQLLIDKINFLVEYQASMVQDWPADEYGPMNATDLIALLEKEFYSVIEAAGVVLE